MFKKVSLALGAAALVAWVLIQFRNMHFYYIKRAEEYTAAQLYLKSDVCANGELARQLGNFARCEESKRILTMSPWASAWYDFLEDMYICGHGRCDVFWDEISGKLPYIILFMGSIMMWIAYQGVQSQRIATSQMMFQLPFAMDPRYQMNHLGPHSHVD
tara:strand:- start:476 stop:952 length:477 start_codon:yes stop_codon:yes gene_type:complete